MDTRPGLPPHGGLAGLFRAGDLLIAFLSATSPCAAETIYLKDGRKIEAPIIERTEKSVTVDWQGVHLTYWVDTIDRIESGGSPPAEPEQESEKELWLELGPSTGRNLSVGQVQAILKASREQHPEGTGDAVLNMFLGHYGYLIEYPPGYTAQAGFLDPEATEEMVLFLPSVIDEEWAPGKGNYASGLIVMSVFPRRRKEEPGLFTSHDSLASYREEMLAEPNVRLTEEQVQVSRPACGFWMLGHTSGPLLHIAVEGQQVLYLFTADKRREPILRNMVATLQDVLPQNPPAQ